MSDQQPDTVVAEKPVRTAGGRFAPGHCPNPKGRTKGSTSVDKAVEKALSAKVVVSDGGKKRKVSKLIAAATQMANKGASGDLHATKMAFHYKQQAEDKASAAPIANDNLLGTDIEIVARFLARVRLFDQERAHVANPD